MCMLVSGFVHLNPAKAGLPIPLGSSSVHLNAAKLNVEFGSGALGSAHLNDICADVEFDTQSKVKREAPLYRRRVWYAT